MKLKALFLALLLTFTLSASAFAGVRILEDKVDRGVVSEINCTDGFECNQNNGYLEMSFKINVKTAATRPSSTYSPTGSMVVITDARSATDCGNVGGGSSFAVCLFNGTNWKALNQT